MSFGITDRIKRILGLQDEPMNDERAYSSEANIEADAPWLAGLEPPKVVETAQERRQREEQEERRKYLEKTAQANTDNERITLFRARGEFDAYLAGDISLEVGLNGAENAATASYETASKYLKNLTPVEHKVVGDGTVAVFNEKEAQSWADKKMTEHEGKGRIAFLNGLVAIHDPIAEKFREEKEMSQRRGENLKDSQIMDRMGFDRPARDMFRFINKGLKAERAEA